MGFKILTQPDETTCGPTCLHSIYRFFGKEIPLQTIIKEVHSLENGGTLAVFLACHALKLGFKATIYTYNLKVFDPSWFKEDSDHLREKLMAQEEAKDKKFLTLATRAYLQFLELGGEVRYEPLEEKLLLNFLDRKVPILTGLSATYLYSCPRENPVTSKPDDVKGLPAGHFVVVYDYVPDRGLFQIADPYVPNPFSENQIYQVSLERLIGSICLGVVTYDANLLVLEPGT